MLAVVRVARGFSAIRVTGLAAEMSYYSLISLLPLTIGLGASLGFLRAIVGGEQVLLIEDVVITGVAQIFSPELTEDVMEPLVRGLLQQEHAGAALIGLMATFVLASAVFRAVIRALDRAYGVSDGRSGLYLWGLAYLLALGSVVVLALVLSLIVVGPLLGGASVIAGWFGLGELFEVLWEIGRWPVVLAVGALYLAWLYRVAPNVRSTWGGALPGAIGATLGIILISVGFQVYLSVAGPRAPEVGAAPEAVAVATQTIGAALAAILWIWLISMVVLSGGLLNAELRRQRELGPGARRPKQAVDAQV